MFMVSVSLVFEKGSVGMTGLCSTPEFSARTAGRRDDLGLESPEGSCIRMIHVYASCQLKPHLDLAMWPFDLPHFMLTTF